jgi:hypothetical protein
MKSKISEAEAKVKDYLVEADVEKGNSNNISGRLDLNIILKRLKDKKASDKKLNFFVISFTALVLTVVLLLIIK